jgi:hypothetical protein
VSGLLIHRAEPSSLFHEKVVLWKTDGRMQALDLRGFETRHESLLRLIAHAEYVYDVPDFPATMIHTGDRPVNDGDASWRSLAFSEAEGYLDVPIPDFLFDGWPQVGLPDYTTACRLVRHAGAGTPEKPVAGWIGNCDTHPIRRVLHALGQQSPELLEAIDIAWLPAPPGQEQMLTAAGNYLSLEEQVRRWSLLIDVEGNGWSARLKLLLHSGRPVLVQERPWTEWYWSRLQPWRDFVPVRSDLGDLTDNVRWLLENDEDAAAIGAAGQAFAREHLTRAVAVRTLADTLTRLSRDPPPSCGPPALRDPLERLLAQLP